MGTSTDAYKCINELIVIAYDAIMKASETEATSIDSMCDMVILALHGGITVECNTGHCERILEELQDLTLKEDKFFHNAFTSGSEFDKNFDNGEMESPRFRRLLLLLGLRLCMPVTPLATDFYLRMLLLPGAFSYQVFDTNVFREAISEDLSDEALEKLSRVFSLPNMKSVEKDVKEACVSALVKQGARCASESIWRSVENSLTEFLKKQGDEEGQDVASNLILRAILEELKQLNRKQRDAAVWIIELLNRLPSGDDEYSVPHLTVLEHLCFFIASSKSAERGLVANNIAMILDAIQGSEHGYATSLRFCQFLSKLSQSRDSNQRQFAVEIACDIFCSDTNQESFAEGLLDLVVARATDSVPGVRAAVCKGLGKMNWNAISEACFVENMCNQRADTLAKCLADEKSNVRKAAIKSLQDIYSDHKNWEIRGKHMENDVTKVAERCRDVALSIRIQALEFLEEVASDFVEVWKTAVFPLVFDPEQSVNCKSIDSINRLVFEPIRNGDINVWGIVQSLNPEQVGCATKAFFDLMLRKEISLKPLLKRLQNQLDDHENNKAAWKFLHMISDGSSTNQDVRQVQKQVKEALDVSHILEQWSRMFEAENDTAALLSCMGVLHGISYRVPAQEASRIANVVFHYVDSRDLSPELCRKSLHVLVALCENKAPNQKQAQLLINEWSDKLQQQCLQFLRSYYKEPESVNDKEMFSNLFIIGELCVLGLDPDSSSKKSTITMNHDLVTLTMGMLTLPSLSSSMRAHLLVTTGKLCLSDSKIAKDATHMLVRELEMVESSDIIRSNVIVILGDLCRRYTNLIDPHLEIICACLNDPSKLVRRHAVVLLTGLLQEDYIKWRGTIFARFVLCSVDPDLEIRNLVRYALKEIFPEKAPGLYHGNFVDIIFGLNRCLDHTKYQLGSLFITNSDDGVTLSTQRNIFAKRVTGTGEHASKRRHEIFALLLDQMGDAQRLEVTNKICKDILGSLLDGVWHVPIEESPANQVLCDTFKILCSPHIRVKATAKSVASQDDSTVVESVTAQVAMAQAKGRVLGKLERKNLAQNVVPLLVSLYQMFLRQKSPFLRHVIKFLVVLLRDYKEEVQNVLDSDRILSEELQFDIEQERKAQLVEEEAAQTTKKRKLSSISSGSSSGRKSLVTFVPSEKDLSRRASTGVLKTPIPRSSHKKRRHSLLDAMSSVSAPKLCDSENRTPNIDADSEVMSGGGTGSHVKCRSDVSSQREWSVVAHSDVSQNLTSQLEEL